MNFRTSHFICSVLAIYIPIWNSRLKFFNTSSVSLERRRCKISGKKKCKYHKYHILSKRFALNYDTDQNAAEYVENRVSIDSPNSFTTKSIIDSTSFFNNISSNLNDDSILDILEKSSEDENVFQVGKERNNDLEFVDIIKSGKESQHPGLSFYHDKKNPIDDLYVIQYGKKHRTVDNLKFYQGSFDQKKRIDTANDKEKLPVTKKVNKDNDDRTIDMHDLNQAASTTKKEAPMHDALPNSAMKLHVVDDKKTTIIMSNSTTLSTPGINH